MPRVISVLLLVAACGGDDGGAPLPPVDGSAGFDSASSDAAPQTVLIVRWDDDPAIPGPIATVSVTSAAFFTKRLEVIGDAGAPTFTTERDFLVPWAMGTAPSPIYFSSAPPGIYSTIRIELDQDASLTVPSLEILGTVMISGVGMRNFQIVSDERVNFEIGGYSVVHDFNQTSELGITVDLGVALGGVDWAALPEQNNTRILDDTNAAMDPFLASIDDAFTRAD